MCKSRRRQTLRAGLVAVVAFGCAGHVHQEQTFQPHQFLCSPTEVEDN